MWLVFHDEGTSLHSLMYAARSPPDPTDAGQATAAPQRPASQQAGAADQLTTADGQHSAAADLQTTATDQAATAALEQASAAGQSATDVHPDISGEQPHSSHAAPDDKAHPHDEGTSQEQPESSQVLH